MWRWTLQSNAFWWVRGQNHPKLSSFSLRVSHWTGRKSLKIDSIQSTFCIKLTKQSLGHKSIPLAAFDSDGLTLGYKTRGVSEQALHGSVWDDREWSCPVRRIQPTAQQRQHEPLQVVKLAKLPRPEGSWNRLYRPGLATKPNFSFHVSGLTSVHIQCPCLGD